MPRPKPRLSCWACSTRQWRDNLHRNEIGRMLSNWNTPFALLGSPFTQRSPAVQRLRRPGEGIPRSRRHTGSSESKVWCPLGPFTSPSIGCCDGASGCWVRLAGYEGPAAARCNFVCYGLMRSDRKANVSAVLLALSQTAGLASPVAALIALGSGGIAQTSRSSSFTPFGRHVPATRHRPAGRCRAPSGKRPSLRQKGPVGSATGALGNLGRRQTDMRRLS